MKNTIFILLICLALVLSACSGQASAGQSLASPQLSKDSAAAPSGGEQPAASGDAPAKQALEAAPSAGRQPLPSTQGRAQGYPAPEAQAQAYPAAGQEVGGQAAETPGRRGELGTAAVLSGTLAFENAASVPMQLVLGTLALGETDLAVTQEQAVALLPLWAEYQTFSASLAPGQRGQGGPGQPPQDGAALPTPQAPASGAQVNAQMEELNQLLEKIQAAMTIEQITAISEMQITQETAHTMMEELGLTIGAPQAGGPQQADPQMGGGGPGPGADPGGGQPPQDRPGLQDSQAPAAQARVRGGGMLPSPLLDALIAYLTQVTAA